MTSFVHETRVLLKRVHNECLSQIPSLKFDPTGKNQLMTVSLYCSLVEYAGALLTLVANKRRTGFSSVFRSFLEGYADLNNLLKVKDFYFRKEASYRQEWVKVLAESKPTNPYLKGIAEAEDFEKIAKGHKDELKALTDKGYQPVSVFDSFKMADMAEEYHSIYRFECAEAHNDFRALMNRNVKKDGEGKVCVEPYLVPPPDYYLARLDTTLALLLSATDGIHDKVGSKAKEKFVPLWAALHQLRKAQENAEDAPQVNVLRSAAQRVRLL